MPGEIEDVSHGECVCAQVGLRENLSDIGHKGQVPRGPEAADEDHGEGQAHGDTDRRGGEQPRSAMLRFSAKFFGGKRVSQKQENREVCGEGVVLLIGGEGKEQKRDRGPENTDPAGAGTEIEASVLD